MRRHELYNPKDFTQAEYERRNVLAVMVIDGGIGVCKYCGATAGEIRQWPTCEGYRARNAPQHHEYKRRDQSGWQP